MLGGRVQMNIGTISTLAPLVREGKLRALAITSAERNAELPDVPTMAESGLPQLTLRFWMAVWGPPRTPAAIVEKLNGEIVAGLKSQELAAGMARAGFEPMPMDAKTVATFMASELPKWLAVAKTSGVKGD